MRTETAIGNAAVSVPYAAVELAKQIFGSLAGRKVMVLGAGKMSELSARYLAASGASEICVVNRTLEHAQSEAARPWAARNARSGRRKARRGRLVLCSFIGCVDFTRAASRMQR